MIEPEKLVVSKAYRETRRFCSYVTGSNLDRRLYDGNGGTLFVARQTFSLVASSGEGNVLQARLETKAEKGKVSRQTRRQVSYLRN
jgi:hypothetical protein